MDYKFTSRSEDDTRELAENIESEKFEGMVICLNGELGSGKTLFVKGFPVVARAKSVPFINNVFGVAVCAQCSAAVLRGEKVSI